MEFWQFYVSSFWVWAGITFLLCYIGKLVLDFYVATLAALTGTDLHID